MNFVFAVPYDKGLVQLVNIPYDKQLLRDNGEKTVLLKKCALNCKSEKVFFGLHHYDLSKGQIECISCVNWLFFPQIFCVFPMQTK